MFQQKLKFVKTHPEWNKQSQLFQLYELNFTKRHFELTKSRLYRSPLYSKELSLLVYNQVVKPLFINMILKQQYVRQYTNKLNHKVYFSKPDDYESEWAIDQRTCLLKNQKYQYKILFKNEKDHPLYDDEYADVTWGQSFNGVRRSLRFLQTPEAICDEYCQHIGCPSGWLRFLANCTIRIAIPFFKKLKTKIHSFIDWLPAQARYYLEIENLAGYPEQANRQFNDDPVKWLSIPSISFYSKEWWKTKFLQTFGQFIIRYPDRVLTLREYTLARWLWVTDGATKFSKLLLDNEIVKTKMGAALSLTDQELLHHVFGLLSNLKNDKGQIGVFIKPDEKGYKRRLIANVPLGAYIVASYVRYLVESFCGTQPPFMNLSPSISNMLDVIKLLKEKRLAMPLDESAYDYNVSQEAWFGFFDAMKSLFPGNEGIDILSQYFNHAYWVYDGKSMIWNSGMPSGLALTSFLNSWMNYIKQSVVIPSEIHWAAGDDVLTFPADQNIKLEDVAKEYELFGSVAHPLKNWTSHYYAEYLRRFYTSLGTTGYPARIFASIIWHGQERFYLPSDKLPELSELFKQFFDRLGKPLDEEYLARELVLAVRKHVKGFNLRVAKQWLHSPRVHGGFGCLPYNHITFTWEVSSNESKTYTNALIRVPRLLKYHGEVKFVKGTYKITSSSYFLGSRYRLPPIENMEDWERRINREDIEIKGPFANLALDTIPLPCINFVSTSIVSMMAQSYGYNSFPNLSGSWNSISSKLINASISLINVINNLMCEFKLDCLV